MPWTENYYPVSMKNLPVIIRNKAIEIANALLEEGNLDEGIVIATAISHAKQWVFRHGEEREILHGRSRRCAH